jgi:hypothetical protein
MVECPAVNRMVAGSSPAVPAKFRCNCWEIAQLAVRSALTRKVAGSNPALPANFRERRNMDKREVQKILAEIANLRRIASDLEPGSMKQALAKRAADLGKKVSPYVSPSA